MFVKSINGSKFVKKGVKLFEMLYTLIEKTREENIVQVITKNGNNYVLTCKLLDEKRPHLY